VRGVIFRGVEEADRGVDEEDEGDRRIFIMEIPALAISSTDIRQRIKIGRPVNYLVPEGVNNYILKHELYK